MTTIGLTHRIRLSSFAGKFYNDSVSVGGEMFKKAELAEKIYDMMAKTEADNSVLREMLIDAMFENEKLKEENSKWFNYTFCKKYYEII